MHWIKITEYNLPEKGRLVLACHENMRDTTDFIFGYSLSVLDDFGFVDASDDCHWNPQPTYYALIEPPINTAL